MKEHKTAIQIFQEYFFFMEIKRTDESRGQRVITVCEGEQPLSRWHLQLAGHLLRGPGNEDDNANHCHGGLTGVDEWPSQALNALSSAHHTMFLSGHARSTSLHQPRPFPAHPPSLSGNVCMASCQFRKSWFMSQPH